MLRALMVVAALVLTVASPASADHYFGDHWYRAGGPITIPVVGHVASDLSSHLYYHTANWGSLVGGLDLSYRDSGDLDYSACADYNRPQGEIQFCEIYSSDSFRGIVLVVAMGTGHMQEAGLILNRRTAGPNEEHIVCHELGHAIGLAHQPQMSNSCMVSGGVLVRPGTHDETMLQTTIYGDIDPYHYPGPPNPSGPVGRDDRAEILIIDFGPLPTALDMLKLRALQEGRAGLEVLGFPLGYAGPFDRVIVG